MRPQIRVTRMCRLMRILKAPVSERYTRFAGKERQRGGAAMMTERKKTGWNVPGMVGLTFAPMGLLFLILGITFWFGQVGEDPNDPMLFLCSFGGTGAVFLLVGLGLLGSELRRRRLMKRAYEGGNCVSARITAVREKRNVKINHRHPFVVECRWTDPATDEEHVYTSRYLREDVTGLLTAKEAPVYVDRMDARIGFVDIDAALPDVPGLMTKLEEPGTD